MNLHMWFCFSPRDRRVDDENTTSWRSGCRKRLGDALPPGRLRSPCITCRLSGRGRAPGKPRKRGRQEGVSSEFGGERGSWPEAFDNIRGAAPNHWPHLGPIQATRSYCERLEIEAAGLAKEDDEEELILPVLVLGMFFGDAIAKRFRGHWRYS